jgi:rhamnosyltransferase
MGGQFGNTKTFKANMHQLSVIIRSKNEERWIGHAIQSVLDFVKEPEVIILDNRSDDDTKQVARLFSSFNNMRILDVDDYSPGSALNQGVHEASNETILVLSAHCVLTHFDLKLVQEELRTHKAVFGKQVPVYHGKKITPRYLWENFHDSVEVNHYSKAEDRPFLHNGMCAYSKAHLLEKPFDEQLAGKEDRYWAKGLLADGHSYLYHPEIMTSEHHWTRDGNTWKGIG